ncbi:MAG: hypothetical protein KF760_01455 [Candidatus Eremiobacteraeota bacterium]|nr:hypothetical protein [Candidatus Eremiobacteraeota bacterium]MCW5871808.1 hypothetical protein [Candidatus Eremiobacteraeota bacterium]
MSKLAKIIAPLVAVGGLGAAAYYFSSHGSLGGHNVVDLARNTPQKAFLWVAAEMREEASPNKLTEQIAKAKTDYKGFNEFCTDFEKESGKKLEDIVKTYAASGYIAFYIAGGKDHIETPIGSEAPVEVVLDCQLYDPKAADEMLTKVKEKASRETLAGQTVYLNGKDFCLSVAGDSLLVTNNKATMEKAIQAAVQHKGTLAEDEQFKQALSKVPDLGHGNGTAMYLDLNPVWTSIEKAPRVGQYTDADTFKGLRSLPYAIGGATVQGGKWTAEGFLAVNSQSETDLAKAFLKKPTSAHELAGLVPESWGFFQAFDTYYTYELLQAIVRLAPIGRMGLTMGLSRAGLGANGERELQIRQAFNGQTAWAVDMSALSEAGAGAQTRGQTIACKSNLKNIATALEMYSTDYGGRYPENTGPLVSGNYLKTIPTCPAAGKDTYSETYKFTTDPDHFKVRCSDTAAHDLAYDSDQGLLGADANSSSPAAPAPAPKVLGTFLLGVKDPVLARDLMAQLGPWEKVEVAGKEAYRLSQNGAEAYYMLLDKPAALAFGFGPKAKESLTAVAEAAAGQTTSLAKRSNFSSFAGKYSKDSAEISFLNFKVLIDQVKKEALKADQADKTAALQMLALVEGQLSDDLGSIQVEADGLRYTNAGTAGALGMVGALTMPILVPNFIKARSQGQLTACKSNEKNIATALEMYASDNAGVYPTDLKPLISGNYLRLIPTCPAAGKDTYSESYQVETKPDTFSFYCKGHNHGNLLPADLPAYNAEMGLIDRP